MIKASENDFNRAALQQSLQFWRGEPKPSPAAQPSASTPSDVTVAEPARVAKQAPGMLDNGPRPWRYIRWRKAHDSLPQMPKQTREVSRGNFYHRVLPDEDLIEVAEKFATYPEVLMEANHILNPVNIATGQVLWVPRTHPIEWGNTLWSLSNKYNVSISTIQKANGIADPDLIYAGKSYQPMIAFSAVLISIYAILAILAMCKLSLICAKFHLHIWCPFFCGSIILLLASRKSIVLHGEVEHVYHRYTGPLIGGAILS